jgi:hypothetical protein
MNTHSIQGWRFFICRFILLVFSAPLMQLQAQELEKLPLLQTIQFHPDFIRDYERYRQIKSSHRVQKNTSQTVAVKQGLHEVDDTWREKYLIEIYDEKITDLDHETTQGLSNFERSSHLQLQSLPQPFSSKATTDSQSEILKKIQDWMGNQSTTIGLNQVNNILSYNRQFNLGEKNYSGMTWQKPFGGFSLTANRTVAPNQFGGNWVVQDTLTIQLEASTFLSKLNDAGMIQVDQSDLNAFAGLTFNRTYTIHHTASSYMNGLTSDFRKLFLPFTFFKFEALHQSAEDFFIRKEDEWSIRLGGLLSAPPAYHLSFSAGAYIEKTHKLLVSAHVSPTTETSQKTLKIVHELTNKKTVGVAAQLQLDFFKLLEFTLFKYDLSLENRESSAYTLSLNSEQLNKLSQQPDESAEMKRLLSKSLSQPQWLKKYVSLLDYQKEKTHASETQVLLWGKLKKSSLEQRELIKEGIKNIFFVSRQETTKLVQNLWSRLFSSFFFRILQFSPAVSTEARWTKNLAIEYASTRPQSANPNIMAVTQTEDFSLSLQLEYQAQRTHRWMDRAYKKDAAHFVRAYSTLNPDIANQIMNETLRGPVTLNLKILAEKTSFDYFMNRPAKIIENEIAHICESNRRCLKQLRNSYRDFKNHWQTHQEYHLNTLQRFLLKTLDEMSDIQTLITFFGDTLFMSGRIEAIHSGGMPFTQYYGSGTFKGLGVMDTFMRKESAATPVPIDIESL